MTKRRKNSIDFSPFSPLFFERTKDWRDAPTPEDWLNTWGEIDAITQWMGTVVFNAAENLIREHSSNNNTTIDLTAIAGDGAIFPLASNEARNYLVRVLLDAKATGQKSFLELASLTSTVSADATRYVSDPNEQNFFNYRTCFNDWFKAVNSSIKAGKTEGDKYENVKVSRSKAGKASAETRGDATTVAVIKKYNTLTNSSHATHERAGIVARELGISPTHVRRIIKKENFNKAP